MVVLLGGLSLLLMWGSVSMEVLSDAKPGPQFTPMLIGVGTGVVALFLAIDIWRRPEVDAEGPQVENAGFYDMSIDMLHDLAGMKDNEDSLLHQEILKKETWRKGFKPEDDQPARVRVQSDWKTLSGTLASTFGFILILPVAGWVLSATLLFWLIAFFLGSSRPVFDIWISLIVASVVQLIFGGLMGLTLPSGIFGGI